MTAVIFANGDPADGPMVRKWLAHADQPYLLAADGGAHIAAHYGLQPHAVIGDMDSIDPALLAALEAQGAAITRFPVAKDETDLELALIAAAAGGHDPIIIIGAVGSRLDHTLANVYLLALPQLDGRTVKMVSGREEITLLRPGKHRIDGAVGDTISLLPVGGPAAGVRTDGLSYPLRDETLHFGPARGVSNVMAQAPAYISLNSGWLLVIHTEGKA